MGWWVDPYPLWILADKRFLWFRGLFIIQERVDNLLFRARTLVSIDSQLYTHLHTLYYLIDLLLGNGFK